MPSYEEQLLTCPLRVLEKLFEGLRSGKVLNLC
jgi:hypothetical protein